MTTLAAATVLPLHAQVALVDATWQDYPQWETGDERVVYRAPSLIHPDEPPYPGFAVATRADVEGSALRHVEVELWAGEAPVGMTLIHSSVLGVGRAGIELGNVEGGSTVRVGLPRGDYEIEIWVDSDDSRSTTRVVFVLPTFRGSV